jgi:hypothetical protein
MAGGVFSSNENPSMAQLMGCNDKMTTKLTFSSRNCYNLLLLLPRSCIEGTRDKVKTDRLILIVWLMNLMFSMEIINLHLFLRILVTYETPLRF